MEQDHSEKIKKDLQWNYSWKHTQNPTQWDSEALSNPDHLPATHLLSWKWSHIPGLQIKCFKTRSREMEEKEIKLDTSDWGELASQFSSIDGGFAAL